MCRKDRASGSRYFLQSEVTSCGLNGGPFSGGGEYEARIACNLWSKSGVARYDKKFRKKDHPFFTQTGHDRTECENQYIANMRDGSVAGFKYFRFQRKSTITLTVSGSGSGHFEISNTSTFSVLAGDITVEVNGKKTDFSADFYPQIDIMPLYFRYWGTDSINFHKFKIY